MSIQLQATAGVIPSPIYNTRGAIAGRILVYLYLNPKRIDKVFIFEFSFSL